MTRFLEHAAAAFAAVLIMTASFTVVVTAPPVPAALAPVLA